jgi:hypothetical protein
VEEAFDLNDALSIYLTDENRTWVERIYHLDEHLFEDMCARFNKVSVTNNAVVVARYIEECLSFTLFPYVIKAFTITLGAANWRMVPMSEGDPSVHSSVSISSVVEGIKCGVPPKIEGVFGKKLLEISC